MVTWLGFWITALKRRWSASLAKVEADGPDIGRNRNAKLANYKLQSFSASGRGKAAPRGGKHTLMKQQ